MLELAIPSDREIVNELARQVHAMHVAWQPDIYEMVEELYSQERFDEAVKERQLYVAKIDGLIVGYVLVKIREYNWPGVVRRKVMLVDELCVEALCRNQGIGTQMMLEVRALAKAFGCTDLQLGVNPKNEAAIHFYRKCGFSVRNIEMRTKL